MLERLASLPLTRRTTRACVRSPGVHSPVAKTVPMGHLLRALLALLISFSVMVRPVVAQSILRDAETEALLADMSKPLIEAAGLQPKNVQIGRVLCFCILDLDPPGRKSKN